MSLRKQEQQHPNEESTSAIIYIEVELAILLAIVP